MDEPTLHGLVGYIVRALSVCAKWTHTEVLLALSTVLYGNGPQCHKVGRPMRLHMTQDMHSSQNSPKQLKACVRAKCCFVFMLQYLLCNTGWRMSLNWRQVYKYNVVGRCLTRKGKGVFDCLFAAPCIAMLMGIMLYWNKWTTLDFNVNICLHAFV